MVALALSFEAGETSLSVRRFHVEEGLSRLFTVRIEARSPDENVDLESIVGRWARLDATSEVPHSRTWTGVCVSIEQTRVEPAGLSTYEIVLAPTLWRLTQRHRSRIFQHISIPDIVDRVLAEWGIVPTWRIERSLYPRLELRTQYEESDFAFFSRLLEEAGVTFSFADSLDRGSELVLDDRPQGRAHRVSPVSFVDSPGQAQSAHVDYLTAVRLRHEVRPGRHALRDFDFLRPGFALFGQAKGGDEVEASYENYHYRPSAMLVEGSGERTDGALAGQLLGRTPVADDKGVARFSEAEGQSLAERRMEADRGAKRSLSYGTNVISLSPGTIFSIAGHPRLDLSVEKRLLVTHLTITGQHDKEWTVTGSARFADYPYRPPLTTPKPRIVGQQSAMVVGPPGEEIYTDEHGRVRVQFHWDREGKFDDNSSIWMRVSQAWAGPGYGLFTVPRVGHEVLVAYLEGDVDSPYVAGRLHNAVDRAPHRLPENKTVSTFRTSSSPANGGFNELRFDDAAGREHVFLQAEKDHDKLVKNNETSAVGNNLSRLVQNDEAIAVGRDRTKVVHMNELEVTGLNRSAVAGVNRNTVVGSDDATLVGSKFSVTMGRGLTANLTRELSSLVEGPLGPLVGAPVASVLGVLPQTPLGGAALTAPPGAMLGLSGLLPGTFRNVLGTMEAFADERGPSPTSIEMVDRRITLTTGEASIVLDGPNITLMANGNVMIQAKNNVGALADGEAALVAQGKTLVLSKAGDLILQGGPNAHLNPFKSSPTPHEAAVLALEAKGYERVEEAVCERCGAPMVKLAGSDSLVCSHITHGGSR